MNLRRIVLQVGVHREDDLTPRHLESGDERRRLAEVAAETNDMDARIALMQRAQRLKRAVPAAVVDEDDFPGLPHAFKLVAEALVEQHDALDLVEDGDDERERDLRLLVKGLESDYRRKIRRALDLLHAPPPAGQPGLPSQATSIAPMCERTSGLCHSPTRPVNASIICLRNRSKRK